MGATRLSGLLFPESGCGSGVLVSLSAHVDFAEVDRSGVVGEPVDDGVGGDSVGQCSGPVIGPGLAGDHGGAAMLAAGEDREQVAGRVRVDADVDSGALRRVLDVLERR